MYSTTRIRTAPVAHGRRQRCTARRPGGPVLAGEHQGAYQASPAGPTGSPSTSEAPFGLPVLAELPQLAGVLQRLQAADGALLDAVAGLADLLANDTVERTTGVGIEHWLATIGVQTRMDRRLLLRACRLLRRLPSLHAAVRGHRISFAQLRGLTIGLRNARRELDQQLDQLFAALLDELSRLARPDPDVLVRQMVDAVDELDTDDLAARERDAQAGRFLHLQPRLDGTGGTLHAELDAAGLALIDAATTPTAAAIEATGSVSAARLDTLLARLTGSFQTADGEPPAEVAEVAEVADASAAPDWRDTLPAPRLLIRLPFDALLDDRLPADLLTTLVGGRLRLTSAAAARLLERAGTRLRTIIIDDDGEVLGIGRASRRPPGSFGDILAAVYDTCTGPGCDRPARGAQIDHAAPWWPAGPNTPAGTTDLDNLGPLCARTNRDKESAGWQVTQRRGGTRTWVHARSGLTTTTIPTTWRPANDPRRRRPPRPEPPGHHGPGPTDPAPPPPEPTRGGPDALPF
ncbi:hypothetical protein [Egicoccus sp. AB-alg2]|uniref:hypothetical protein n=1 Tax=Egicoccus sp. AB-alg2 TaxID=3242693 RepID=UPI00359E6548